MQQCLKGFTLALPVFSSRESFRCCCAWTLWIKFNQLDFDLICRWQRNTSSWSLQWQQAAVSSAAPPSGKQTTNHVVWSRIHINFDGVSSNRISTLAWAPTRNSTNENHQHQAPVLEFECNIGRKCRNNLPLKHFFTLASVDWEKPCQTKLNEILKAARRESQQAAGRRVSASSRGRLTDLLCFVFPPSLRLLLGDSSGSGFSPLRGAQRRDGGATAGEFFHHQTRLYDHVLLGCSQTGAEIHQDENHHWEDVRNGGVGFINVDCRGGIDVCLSFQGTVVGMKRLWIEILLKPQCIMIIWW